MLRDKTNMKHLEERIYDSQQYHIEDSNNNALFILSAIVIAALVIGIFFYNYISIESGWPPPEKISQVEVGMSKDKVFNLLGEKGWDEYDEDGFDYGWNFIAPNGYKQTFWVTIKNDKVTNIYTCC